MSEMISGDFKITDKDFNGVVMDSKGIRFSDGSGYDARTDTVLVTPDSTFRLYRKQRGFLSEKWVLIANIVDGNGTSKCAGFKQI